MSEQDVVEKLAAAGWGPKTKNGDEIIVFIPGDDESLASGIVRRGKMRHGMGWGSDGEGMAGIGFDLVPIANPINESEQLADALKALGHYKTAQAELQVAHDAWRAAWFELCNATGCAGHVAALKWIRQAREVGENLKRELNTATRQLDAAISENGVLIQEIADLNAAAKERDELRIVREALTNANKQLSLQLRDAETAKVERDEARELCRRFRVLFPSPWSEFDVESFKMASSHYRASACCRDYDEKFIHSAPPMQGDSGELVPWTAATRPRGVVLLVRRDDERQERIVIAWNQTLGNVVGWGWVTFEDMKDNWEWSRDGVNWQPCGVRKAVQK